LRRRRERIQPVYAAVDLGTNNCRLLIARPTRRGFRVAGSFSRIVRLGEGLAETGRLSQRAMDRAVEALKICAGRMRSHDVQVSRNVATEACRRATNCGEFIARVAEETGLTFETITSEEEARLAVAGCRNLFRRGASRALVFDIGGGSTELIWVDRDDGGGYEIEDIVSLPYGVVTLSERCGGDVTPPVYEELVAEVIERLTPFDARNRIGECIAADDLQVLGTSGTVTTLGAVHLGLKRYSRTRIDGLDVGFDSLVKTGRDLAAMDYRARVAVPCIGAERAELVVPGSAILEAIRNTWPVGEIRIADRGLREGMLLELMAAGRARAAPPQPDAEPAAVENHIWPQ
jgi:exopolyphosphatase/guanosine-5'-triphosphate,3'-diphosphate pyrophosphatase